MHLLTKSVVAFRMSYDILTENSERLYFWTFTSHAREHDWVFSRAWQNFCRRLVRYTPDNFAALRVFEAHHGGGERDDSLHCHMVCNARLSVAVLKRLADGTGMGQVMWVKGVRCDMKDYLCKYMTKEFRRQNVRTWAKMGYWNHVCKNRLVVESTEANAFRACARIFKQYGAQSPYLSARAWMARTSSYARPEAGRQILERCVQNRRNIDRDGLWEALKGFPVPDVTLCNSFSAMSAESDRAIPVLGN